MTHLAVIPAARHMGSLAFGVSNVLRYHDTFGKIGLFKEEATLSITVLLNKL